MERASIANLFNDLEFEMPPPDGTPIPTSPAAIELTYPLNVQLTRKENKRLQKMMKKANKKQVRVDNDEKEPGWLRQCWSATTKRPLSEMQCNDYLQDFGGTLSDPIPYSTIGSRTSTSEDSPPPRMEFLFFGGSSDESVHSSREIGADLRRYRAHFMAQQPVPSCTRSIPVKPTLVRNLPPVFEPTLTCMLY